MMLRRFLAARLLPLLSLFLITAFSQAEEPLRPGPVQAGAAVTDITPELGVSLDGLLLKSGPVKEIVDPLEARCLVLDNGQTRLALVVCDVCVMSGEVIDEAKALAEKKTGLAASQVMVSATHTHMAPRMAGWYPVDGTTINQRYYQKVSERIAEAIEQAIKNLSPAKIGWVVGQKPDYLRNRRWIMKPGTVPLSPFGEATDQVVMGGSPAKNRVKPAGPVDPELLVLSVQHADGQPLALFSNYSLHLGVIKSGVASADYFGRFNRQVEKLLKGKDSHPPVVAIMSNGASADINSAGGNLERMQEISNDMAEEAIGLLDGIQYHNQINLGVLESEIELGVRKPSKERLAWATDFIEQGKEGVGRQRIYAAETIHLSKFPESVSVKLQAIRIGGLGLVAVPGEVFVETGVAIKKQSPLQPTFTISHANGWHGYLPTPRQHKLGGMEVWARRASYLEVDGTTKIEHALLSMLRKLQPDQ